MVTKHKAMLSRLKKQVSALKRKERTTRVKLHNALLKVKKIVIAYEKKLIRKTRATEAAVYARLAKTINKKVKKLKAR